MTRFVNSRRVLAALLVVVAVAGPVRAQAPRERFANLKVLPQDIAPDSLRAMMNGFTRALGVRCIHCHVGEEGKPFAPGAFALDDKPAKAKARVMIAMTRDLNEKYLTQLATRSTPPAGVQCFTCHRGVPQPRMLADVLQATYDTEGIDSTVTAYQALRERYYGRAAYDFGDVPLADVGSHLRFAGHGADAERLLSLNLEMNPKSMFAKRQYANAAIAMAFADRGIEGGTAVYRDVKSRLGESVVTEGMLNDVGYTLLGEKQPDVALAVFQLNTTEHPESGNAFDSLGEAYMNRGDKARAIEAYRTSLALDPANDNATKMLAQLGAKPAKAKPKTKR